MKFLGRRPIGVVRSAVLLLLCALLPAAASAGSLAVEVEDWQSGEGIASAYVQIYHANRGLAGHFRTDLDGVLVAQLAPGAYLVAASFPGYESQVFDGVAFNGNSELGPALLQGRPVTVPEEGRVDLAPMRLRKLGRISGFVLDAASGEPIAGARVWVFEADLQMRTGQGDSGEDGSFAVEDLVPGTYYLLADGPGMRDLLVGGDEACTVRNDDYRYYANCDPTRGTPFTVGYGETVDAGEIGLPAEGRIRGTLRLDEGRVAFPFLKIYNTSHRLLAELYPPGRLDEWNFDLPVPGGGTYYLAGEAPEHLVQVYDHADCVMGELYCTDFSGGTAVTVAPGQQRSGLDFDLRLDRRPCQPSPTTLCLLGGRFSVSGHNFGPHMDDGGPNQAGRVTEEAGYFTFYHPDNVEIVVKVLDACQEFGAFWVYTAGMTDVLNILQVRDNWTAESQRYDHYGVHKPYLPRVDRTTFQGCGIGPPEPEPADAVAAPLPAAPLPVAAPLPAPIPELVPNGCGSDPEISLCLGGRFAVKASWTTAEGQTGSAGPAPLTADTGFFHFFSPDNIEVVVKVLDACRADLGNRYWVFAAGMTDVAVTLTVTDTANGDEKLYMSPLGGLFQPILDLDAFDGCP